jgi:hypothetical protein
VVNLIEVQQKMRSAQIGDQPISGMEEALRRNYETGISHGLKLVPTIVKGSVMERTERYRYLLAKSRGEEE